MFEVATQFNAIFRTQTNSQNSVALLSMWISRRVHTFLETLRREISVLNDSASLRDVLDASVFLAVSLGRLGADFSALLPPLFEDKMLSLVVNAWEDGARQLSQTLKSCRDAGVSSPLSSTCLTSNENEGAMEPYLTSDSGPMPPPRQLMSLPPIGRFTNSILTGLNELRRCLLPGVFTGLRSSLDRVLLEVDGILESNERSVMTPGLAGEASELRGKAKEMRKVYEEIVVPYVRGAFEFSLGNETLSVEYHSKLFSSLRTPEAEPAEIEQEDLASSVGANMVPQPEPRS